MSGEEESRQQAIALFKEVTHTEDEAQAARLLEWHGWQVEPAVHAFMLGEVDPPASYFARRAGAPNSGGGGGSSGGGANVGTDAQGPGFAGVGMEETDALLGGGGDGNGPGGAGGGGAQQAQGWLGWTVGLPFRGAAWAFGHAMAPVQYLLGTEDPPRDGEAAARRFVSQFEAKFGRERRPSFIQDSYQEAVAQASREAKFLVVYLHSPLHEDTPEFCKEVLCSETMVEFLDSNFLVWGGSVWFSEAYAVGNLLGATTFPSTTLLMCRPNEVQVIERVPGSVAAESLMERLSGAMARFQEHLDRVRRQLREREDASRLRREQDAEFQEALEADRRRQEAEAEEQRRRQAELQEEQNQADLARAAEESRVNAKAARLEQLRSSVPPEPPLGQQDATRVRLQLPAGKLDRRFVKSQTVGQLRDFVTVHLLESESPIERFSLSTNYPRRLLEEGDDVSTLEEAGLHPQALLFVQDLDA